MSKTDQQFLLRDIVLMCLNAKDSKTNKQTKNKNPILLIGLGHPKVLNYDATSFQTMRQLTSYSLVLK